MQHKRPALRLADGEHGLDGGTARRGILSILDLAAPYASADIQGRYLPGCSKAPGRTLGRRIVVGTGGGCNGMHDRCHGDDTGIAGSAEQMPLPPAWASRQLDSHPFPGQPEDDKCRVCAGSSVGLRDQDEKSRGAEVLLVSLTRHRAGFRCTAATARMAGLVERPPRRAVAKDGCRATAAAQASS